MLHLTKYRNLAYNVDAYYSRENEGVRLNPQDEVWNLYPSYGLQPVIPTKNYTL